MKKIFITTAILLLLYIAAAAQPFVGIAGTDKGAAMQIGYLDAGGLQFSLGYKMPLLASSYLPDEKIEKTNASLVHVSVGYQILLSHKEEDNYSLTPAIGYAMVKYKTLEYAPAAHYSLELGKDAHLGRFFLGASYSKQLYFSLGIKAFLR